MFLIDGGCEVNAILTGVKLLGAKFLGSFAKVALMGITSDFFDETAANIIKWCLRKLAKSTKTTLDDEIVERYIREIDEAMKT